MRVRVCVSAACCSLKCQFHLATRLHFCKPTLVTPSLSLFVSASSPPFCIITSPSLSHGHLRSLPKSTSATRQVGSSAWNQSRLQRSRQVVSSDATRSLKEVRASSALITALSIKQASSDKTAVALHLVRLSCNRLVRFSPSHWLSSRSFAWTNVSLSSSSCHSHRINLGSMQRRRSKSISRISMLNLSSIIIRTHIAPTHHRSTRHTKTSRSRIQ